MEAANVSEDAMDVLSNVELEAESATDDEAPEIELGSALDIKADDWTALELKTGAVGAEGKADELLANRDKEGLPELIAVEISVTKLENWDDDDTPELAKDGRSMAELLKTWDTDTLSDALL